MSAVKCIFNSHTITFLISCSDTGHCAKYSFDTLKVHCGVLSMMDQCFVCIMAKTLNVNRPLVCLQELHMVPLTLFFFRL